MLEKPNIQDEKIVACLRDYYGLTVAQVAFLPLGADANAAVYRVVAEDKTPYFLKLHSGSFDETAVLLPRFLHDQGIRQIIAPIPTTAGRLWGSLERFTVILYPFIDGKNGWEVELTDSQWIEFGAAFRQISQADSAARTKKPASARNLCSKMA